MQTQRVHLGAAAPGQQRGLVDHVGQLGAGEAAGQAREHGAQRAAVATGRQRRAAQVHAQDGRTRGLVRQRHCHPPRQPPRPRQRRVQHLLSSAA